MRVYTTLEEAASEIKRDIFKSPMTISHSVQNIGVTQQAHEALDYSYSVIDMPAQPSELIDLGIKLGFYQPEQKTQMFNWLLDEMVARIKWKPGRVTEYEHPHLRKLINNAGELDYTYTDRLAFGIRQMAEILATDYSSRRAFWPIFQPEDVKQATRKVRIPCSLGYQALIRHVSDQPYLHLTYYERSCDFNRFWLSDIWLARQWQRALQEEILRLGSWSGVSGLRVGNTSHHIGSFHAFIDEEVY